MKSTAGQPAAHEASPEPYGPSLGSRVHSLVLAAISLGGAILLPFIAWSLGTDSSGEPPAGWFTVTCTPILTLVGVLGLLANLETATERITLDAHSLISECGYLLQLDIGRKRRALATGLSGARMEAIVSRFKSLQHHRG